MNISVIIPVFNAEKFLISAVESAINQDEVTEILLIEDNSLDNSLSICNKLEKKYKNVRLFQHPDKMNHGAAASRNLGVIKASNEWVSFLDADDVYLKNRFEHIPKLIKNHDIIDGIYDAIGVFFESEKNKKEWQGGELTTIKSKLDPEELLYYILMGKGHFHLNGLTVKKELLINVGLFDEKLRLHQDNHLCGKIAAIGILLPGKIDSSVALRRVHDANRYSGSQEKFTQSRVMMYKSLWKWVRSQKKLKKKFLKLLLTHYLYVDAMKQASVAEKKYYRNVFRIISRIYRYKVIGTAVLFRGRF